VLRFEASTPELLERYRKETEAAVAEAVGQGQARA